MSPEQKIALVSRIGMDIAKDVFQLHGVDGRGVLCFRKKVSRQGLLVFTQQLPKCEIAMESCSGSHYWGRELEKQGHRVKLLPAQHVKPFVPTGNKDDRVDAAAICEAAARPTINAVPIKSHDQLDLQAIHRHRRQLSKRVTMLSNQMRGFLGEYGIAIPQGVKRLPESVSAVLGDATNDLSGLMRDLVRELFDDFWTTRRRLSEIDARLKAFCKENDACRRVLAVPGAGILTATAVYAAIGNGRQFKNGREAADWVGLIPSHRGTGGKTRVGALSRKGNRYLKVLLIRGGQAVVRHAGKKADRRSQRLHELSTRSTTNVAAVASAHRTMRVIWAVLASGQEYREAA